MNTDQSKYVNRVRALLAKAEATEFSAEAETLTARAFDLMAKHNIDATRLDAQDPGVEPIHDTLPLRNPRAGAKAALLAILAEGMNCSVIRERDTPGSKVGVAHLFGFPGDVKSLKIMYASILMQFEAALSRVEVPAWEPAKAYRNAWAVGYLTRVQERMEATRESAVAEAVAVDSSFALVLADKGRAVKAMASQFSPGVRKSRAISASGSKAGLRAGFRAGGRADIGNARLAGRRGIGA